MSKIVESRFEYVCVDTASLSVVPPTYPPVQSAYQSGYIGTTSESYGVIPVASAGGAINLPSIPAGATLTLIPDATCTTLVGIGAGGAVFSGGPQQIVTVPGTLVAAAPSIQAYSTSFAPISTAFSATIAWAL